MPYRVVVAGDRRLKDYDLVCAYLDRALAAKLPDVVIVSGAAAGADQLGERYASDRGLAVERFPADWTTYGRAAGPVRNAAMALRADAVVVFDGGGRGSADMARQAKRQGLPLRVVPVAFRPGGELVRPGEPLPACPACKRPLDRVKMCCWKCNWRACERCGQNTTSPIITLCLTCDLKEKEDG